MTAYLAQANTGADALVTTRAVSKPGGVATGDVGVFWLVRWSDAASFPAVSPPAGAVLRGTITNGTEQTQVYLHRVDAETTFTYSWTGSRWSALSALFFSGVDPALDLATVPFQSATGSGTSITTLTLTTVDAAALAWNVNTIATSGVTHTPPTSFTEVADVSPWASAYRIAPGTGSQSAAGAVNSPTAQWAAGLVALAPATSGGVTGDAAVSGTGTLTASGVRAAAGSAAVSATASLAASGLRATEGSAAVAAAATLTAGGLRDATGGATSTTTAALAVSGVRGAVAETGAAVTANMTADGTVSTSGGAEFAAVAALAASGQRSTAATAGLVASAALTAGGVRSTQTDAGLAAEAALATQGQVTRGGDTALTATATLAADGTTGTPPAHGDAALNATGTLTAAGERAAATGGALNAAAVLAASGAASSTRTATLAATASLTASGTTGTTGDDVDVTVGSPYSPWAVASPHAGDWEVAAPW